MASKIKTVEDAFAYTGRTLPDFSFIPEKDRKATEAHYKLTVVAEALNKEANKGKEWKPDWTNYDENKYFPYFRFRGSGVGFAYHVYDYRFTSACVGSRLCFKTSDLAKYAATQFVELYNDYFTIE